MPVVDVLSSLEPAHPLLALAPRQTRCEAGQSWLWDGVRFDVLRPLGSDYLRALKPNAMSCVLHVSADHGQGGSALLTGDIEHQQELALVAEWGAALRSSVLIVAHHGSKTSSTPEFLAAVAPHTAVIQAGYRNRFSHPAPEVVARLQERGIYTPSSPSCGAWRWASAASARGTCERETTRRYWRHAAPEPGPAPED